MRILTLVFLFFCGHAQAAAETGISANVTEEVKSSKIQPNLNPGNWEVGGNFAIGYSSYYGTAASVSPTLKYFAISRFSLGITGNYSSSGEVNSYGIGPSLSYYFFQSDRWTAYLGEDFLYNSFSYKRDYASPSGYYYGEKLSYWSSVSKLGVNYFITPEVAFGPSFVYTMPLDGASTNSGTMTLLGNFGLFF